jgi:hypothetical protein
VLIGAVDVVNAPRLFPANALLDATGAPTAFKLSIDSATGRSVTVFPNCVNSRSFVSASIIDVIKDGSYPPIISCGAVTVPGVPATALLGNLFILDSAETKTLQNLNVAYNTYLKAKADSIGFAYFDPNNATTGLIALKTAGAIPALPNFTSPTAPFGTYVSLDGVHPRFPGQKWLANGLIDVINAKYQTTIPKLASVTTP